MGKQQARSFKKVTGLVLSAGLIVGSMTPMAENVQAEGVLDASDLFISEYVEGSGSNKAIELFNGTSTDIDLTAYTIELYSNGGTTPRYMLNLSGTLQSGATYVIANSSADATLTSKADAFSSVTYFNGDDTIVLKKGDTILDVFGQIGFDPGSKWGTTVATAEQTLVRKDTVTSGDSDGSDAFDPAVEWTSLPQNTFSNIGMHTFHGVEYGEPSEPPAPVTPISIADARATAEGESVTVKGIVTAKLANSITIQDATGGIAIRPTSLDVNVGEEVVVTGTVGSYRELLQLNNTSVVSKQSAAVPDAQIVTGAELGEDLESELVTVQNVTLSGSGQNWTATDGTKEFIVRDERNILDLQTDINYSSITGILQQYNDDYQIIPRDASDTVIDTSILRPAVAAPGAGVFIGPQDVTLSTTTADSEIFYTLDGSDPKDGGLLYDEPIHIDSSTTLKTVVKAEDTFSAVTTYDYKITDKIRIHDIQGASHTSPMNGQAVEGVEGVVTETFTSSNGTTYYFIQTPDAEADGDVRTSEALILYGGRSISGIQVGDLVKVSGKVSEYAIEGYSDRQQTDMKMTEIDVRRGSVEVIASDVALPTPITIDASNLPTEFIDSDNLAVFNPDKDAIDFWESLEGMRVETNNVKAVGPQQYGDLVTVLEETPTETENGGILLQKDDPNAERIQFRLEPNREARDFDVATGDRFVGPVVGVVSYSYGNYKIQASLEDMKAAFVEGDAQREKTFIKAEEDQLTIASYNLENFSNNVKETSDEKALKLAKAFVEELNSPDIIGVTEVQDNDGQDADAGSAANESYQRLIDNIVAIGGKTYKYVNIDPENNQDGGAPNANIRVGFLYDPERVSLTEGMPAGDATTAVGYVDGKLTHNPGRIDPLNPAFESSRKPLAAQFDFQGENVIVIANHWNSKRGDTGVFGSQQPVVLGSEVQRKQIAQIVHDFIADVKTENPEANVVALGDFNDFEFSDALEIFKGDFMTNMVETVPVFDRYSYIYQGNSQVLDHIFVSNHLAAATKIDMIHVNADFTEMSGRASDHDPVLAQIDFTPEPEAELTRYTVDHHPAARLVLQKDFIGVAIGDNTDFHNGILVRGAYTELTGDALKDIVVRVKPKRAGAIIDFNGATVKEVIVEGDHLAAIHGAKNVQRITYVKGASPTSVILK